MRGMSLDPVKLLAEYAPDETTLSPVQDHAVNVWHLARNMTRHMENMDYFFLYRSCLLHDMGRLIYPPGTPQAIRHGIAGAKILYEEGLPGEAKVAERHIGIGISAEDVLEQGLPLPVADYVPRTPVEYIVAHADNLDGIGIRDELDVEERFATELGSRYRRRVQIFHQQVRRILDRNR